MIQANISTTQRIGISCLYRIEVYVVNNLEKDFLEHSDTEFLRFCKFTKRHTQLTILVENGCEKTFV